MKIIQYRLDTYINHLGMEYWNVHYQGVLNSDRFRPGGPAEIEFVRDSSGYMLKRLYGPDDIDRTGNEF